MPVIARILSYRTNFGSRITRALETVRRTSTNANEDLKKYSEEQCFSTKMRDQNSNLSHLNLLDYRFTYPEFLPDPNPEYRNAMREKLERLDMVARRSIIGIPEFYVGSIMAVTYSEPHAPGKTNGFLGICIQRKGCGLRANFILRNVIDNQGIEMAFDLYDPTIRKIECIRLEKRLDDELLYLRDAPLEYSSFPFDMDPEPLPTDANVPINEIKVPLNPPPWLERWERKNLKGATNIIVNEKRQKLAASRATPWTKYDLMDTYRNTIAEEEQKEIFAEIYPNLRELEITRHKLKRKRSFERPKKSS